MKLSVIVVTYNESQYINDIKNSILEQQVDFEYEIIVGDDGSDDGTIEQIVEWEKTCPNMKYFVMERDKDNKPVVPSVRVSNVIRRALQIAQGEYFCIIAGDDFYCNPEKFAKQIRMLDQHKECAGCASAWNLYWNEDKKSVVYPITWEKIFDTDAMKNMLWGSCVYFHIASFVFRNVFLGQKSIADTEIRFLDDTGFVWLMYQKGAVCYLNEVTFCYRQREKSIMSSMDLLELAVVELLLICDELKMSPKSKKYIYARRSKPLYFIFSNRRQLHDVRYKKYIDLAYEMNAELLLKLYEDKVTMFFNIKLFYYKTVCFMSKLRRKYVYLKYKKMAAKKSC